MRIIPRNETGIKETVTFTSTPKPAKNDLAKQDPTVGLIIGIVLLTIPLLLIIYFCRQWCGEHVERRRRRRVKPRRARSLSPTTPLAPPDNHLHDEPPKEDNELHPPIIDTPMMRSKRGSGPESSGFSDEKSSTPKDFNANVQNNNDACSSRKYKDSKATLSTLLNNNANIAFGPNNEFTNPMTFIVEMGGDEEGEDQMEEGEEEDDGWTWTDDSTPTDAQADVDVPEAEVRQPENLQDLTNEWKLTDEERLQIEDMADAEQQSVVDAVLTTLENAQDEGGWMRKKVEPIQLPSTIETFGPRTEPKSLVSENIFISKFWQPMENIIHTLALSPTESKSDLILNAQQLEEQQQIQGAAGPIRPTPSDQAEEFTDEDRDIIYNEMVRLTTPKSVGLLTLLDFAQAEGSHWRAESGNLRESDRAKEKEAMKAKRSMPIGSKRKSAARAIVEESGEILQEGTNEESGRKHNGVGFGHKRSSVSAKKISVADQLQPTAQDVTETFRRVPNLQTEEAGASVFEMPPPTESVLASKKKASSVTTIPGSITEKEYSDPDVPKESAPDNEAGKIKVGQEIQPEVGLIEDEFPIQLEKFEEEMPLPLEEFPLPPEELPILLPEMNTGLDQYDTSYIASEPQTPTGRRKKSKNESTCVNDMIEDELGGPPNRKKSRNMKRGASKGIQMNEGPFQIIEEQVTKTCGGATVTVVTTVKLPQCPQDETLQVRRMDQQPPDHNANQHVLERDSKKSLRTDIYEGLNGNTDTDHHPSREPQTSCFGESENSGTGLERSSYGIITLLDFMQAECPVEHSHHFNAREAIDYVGTIGTQLTNLWNSATHRNVESNSSGEQDPIGLIINSSETEENEQNLEKRESLANNEIEIIEVLVDKSSPVVGELDTDDPPLNDS